MKPSRSNPIRFRREEIRSPMLRRDSSGALAEAIVTSEIRFDPLTGRACRLMQYPLERITRPDIDSLLKKSLELGCPFCPPRVGEIIPHFAPEIAPKGVIRRGRALAFPNINPYDAHGAVVVISDRHFIALSEFTEETVLDALLAAQTFIKRALQADPAARYGFIAWNYLFPSGGSLIHPHLQCNAGHYPTNYQKEVLEASREYHEANGSNYWQDLIESERQNGERYIGDTGDIAWLASFAPRGRLSDVMAIFRGRASVAGLPEADLRRFAGGLLRVFRFLDELNVLSFNMATCSGFDDGQFWAHARITPRSHLLYSPIETSDQFYYQLLHDENVCMMPPEFAGARLKEYFKGQKEGGG
jgi:UDPglucose--hexose-1-phosphate uridylyltransferase